MKLHFPSYEELDDLPSLVNSLRAMGNHSPISAIEILMVMNAATAIEGQLLVIQALKTERDGLAEDCRSQDVRIARLLAAQKAANDGAP